MSVAGVLAALIRPAIVTLIERDHAVDPLAHLIQRLLILGAISGVHP